MQKANRFALSLLLGVAGGATAGLAFAAATAGIAGLAGLGIAISPLVAVAVPILVGMAVGYGVAIGANHLKNTWFAMKPEYFGGSY